MSDSQSHLQRFTMSGSKSDSQIPYRLELAVPATTKSLAKLMQPIRSIEQMKGTLPLGSIPAMTGSVKKGPNLAV